MRWSKLISIGRSKLQGGETKDAIRYFKKALVIAEKNGSKIEEAVSLERLGHVYSLVEDYRDALYYYEKGMEIVQETDKCELMYEICSGTQVAHSHLGNLDQCMKYSKQAFNIAALRLKDREAIAMSYVNLGCAFMGLSDFKNSIKCEKKAIDLYKQMNDQDRLARCYGNLSESYRRQGKYHDAVCFKEESLKRIIEIGDKKSEVLSYLSLGDIYYIMNDIDKATALYQKSLSISKEINNKRLEAQCYMRLGSILQIDQNYQGAIFHYSIALEISEAIAEKYLQADISCNIGNCFHKSNQIEEANKHLNTSLTIAKEINSRSVEAKVYSVMADVNRQMNDFQSAISLLEKCLDIASTTEDKELEGSACSKLGHVYYSLHKNEQKNQECLDADTNITKSEEYLRKALQCFDFLLKHLEHRDQFKISRFDEFQSSYKLLTTILLETKRPLEALLISDGGRARALEDCLNFKYVMIEKEELSHKPLTHPDVEAILSRDVFSLLHYSLLTDSLAVWVLAEDSMEVKVIKNELFDSAMKALAKEEMDEFSILRLFADTVSRAYDMMKIKESMTCENRCLDDCITPIVDVVAKATESYSRDDGTTEELNQASHPLEELYKCLVEPVLGHLKHDDVVIVPDGSMYRVPFAALRDPNTGLYLSDIKRIRLAPSIAILKVLQNCSADHHSQEGALIVGDPNVGEVMFKGEKKDFKRLHFAGIEVNALSRILKSTALTGEQATKEAVMEKMREGSAVIHIAAHGSSENGEIVLAPNDSPGRLGIPEEDDYLLTMKEVQQIGIKAQLVVLSCCYSGRGEIRAEGMIGMSRAFLAAGARAVIASLWVIDDNVTLRFMMNFYDYLTRGESASVSLHKATHDIRKDGYSDPKYWAPFFLIGDDVILSLKR